MNLRKHVFSFVTIALMLVTFGCATSKINPKEQAKGEIYLAAGNDALFKGQYTQALSALLEAVKYLPKNMEAWNSLGLAYLGKEQPEKAEEVWQNAISIDSKSTSVRNSLSALYIQQNRLLDAEKILKVAAKDLIYDRNYLVHYNLGLVYLRQKKQLLAEQELKISVRENETYCAAWYQLGMLQKDRGIFGEAAISLKNALKGTCFNNPELHYEVADLYLKDRNRGMAKSKMLEVIELFPHSDWAKKAEISLNKMR